jgi:translocation and assembly module TamB
MSIRPTARRTQRGAGALRLLPWTLFGAALALLAGVALLLGTSAGSAWLLAQVPGLQVGASRGALAGGTFEAERVQWQSDAGRLVVERLRWDDLVWHWRPHAGAWIGADILRAGAARVEWRSAPASDTPLQAPTTLRLPLHLRLFETQVARIEVDDLPALTDATLDAELGAEEGRLHRVSRLAADVAGVGVRATGQIATDGELPLAFDLQLHSQPQRRPAWQGRVEASGPLQGFALQGAISVDEPAATLDARARVAPFASWPLPELQLESRDLDLSALHGGAPRTRLNSRAQVRGTGFDQPIEVEVEVDNQAPARWDQGGLPLATLRLQLGGRADDRSTVELHRFEARLADGRRAAGRWSGSGRWQGNALALRTTIEALRPALLDARAPDVTLDGPLTLDADGLPAPDPASTAPRPDTRSLRAQMQLGGRLLGRGASPPARVDADLTATQQGPLLRVELARLRAIAAPASAHLSASAARDAAGAWTVASRGTLAGLDPAPWWTGAGSQWLRSGPSRVNADWAFDVALPPHPPTRAQPDAAGVLRTLRGEARLTVADSTLGGLPVALSGRWQHARGAAAGLLRADADLAGNRAQLQVDRSGDDLAWRGRVEASQWSRLQPLARSDPALARWLPRAGEVGAEFTAEGRWPALTTRGDVRVRGLRLAGAELQQATASWTVSLDPAARPDAPLRLALDLAGLARGEQRVDRLRARLDGSWAAHRAEVDASAPLQPPDWLARWNLGAATPTHGTALRLRAQGQWQPDPRTRGGRWQARVAELRAAPADRAGDPVGSGWLHARDVDVEAEVDDDGVLRLLRAEPGRLELLDAVLAWRELSWAQPTDTAASVAQVDAVVEPFAAAPWLARLQPATGWSGDLRLGARLQLRAADRFDADVVVERVGGDLEVGGNGYPQTLGLTDLRLAMTAHDGTWFFTQAAAGTAIGVLAGAQAMRLSPQARWPAADTPMEGVLELRVANLGVWAPWVPPGWRLGGELRASAGLGGRFGAPEFTGELSGKGLAVRNLLQGVDVRDGELEATLKGPEARIETFSFRGGDGLLALTGGATFGERPQVRLDLVADRFQLLGRVDRRIVVSGSAALALAGDTVRVDGRFGVDRGLIDFTRADAPSLDADVTVVRRGEAPPEPAATALRPRRQWEVDIVVDLGRQLRLRGRGLDTRLRGELALSLPRGQPWLEGTVNAYDGVYRAYGQNLRIERGRVVFTGQPENPRLDILALRPNLEVEVGVEVGGTAQSPRVRLFSNPAMADVDKLSWLLLGSALDALGRSDAAIVQAAALALLAGEEDNQVLQPLRALGFDRISVSQGTGVYEGDTVVTVGRQLTRDLYIAYRQGIDTANGSVQLIYRVSRLFTVRAQTGDDTAIDVIWTWRWN